MATLAAAARIAISMPDVTDGVSGGHRTWFVSGKAFAWDRPFTKADIRRYGDETPPDGPILAVRVRDIDEKDAALALDRAGFFTTSHFDGYPVLLIQLRAVSTAHLRDAIRDAWLACAARSADAR